MDNKPINKAAYKQAALQIAAGIRRLERAEKFTDSTLLDTAITYAEAALKDVRRKEA